MTDFNKMDYKNKFKKYNLTVEELSVMFGAKSSISFRNSTAYKRYLRATLRIIEKVEKEIKAKILD
jgi:hypothetical protein